MPRGIGHTLCGFILLLLPISAQAADIPDSSLSSLKVLVGEWKGTDTDGKPHKVAYALSSGGTSLTETLTPPDNPAMTTMYYSDGDQLMLTHYCSLNNQPRMRTNGVKEGEKASCHSDYVDPETAKQLQEKSGGVVVQLDVRPALGIGKSDRTI